VVSVHNDGFMEYNKGYEIYMIYTFWKTDTYKLVVEGSNLPPNRNVLSGVHV